MLKLLSGKIRKSLAMIIIFVFTSAILPFGTAVVVKAETSGDAYVNYDSATGTWTMGTASVEKKLQLQNGIFKLTSFKNKLTNREYIQGTQDSDEFSVTVDNTEYTGLSGSWVYDNYTVSTLSQGELKLVVTFHNNVIKVTRNYIVYPSTGVIQEWSIFQNTSGSSRNFTEPGIFRQRLMQNDVSSVDMHYMTGGGNFTGSHTLKTVSLTSSYSRTFDSRGPAEYTTGGVNDPVLIEGAAAWHEFFALRNRTQGDGVFLTFDYAGTWFSNIGNVGGKNISLIGKVHMVNHAVAAGNSITTPKSMTGVFKGDLDDMGNTITDYQYRYKWDLTRDRYLAKANSFDLLGYQDKQPFDYTPNIFAAANNCRYLGVEINLIDDFWYDKKGDWNAIDSENFAQMNQYINKNGQEMCVWMAPWHAQTGSTVLNQHPDWQVQNDNDYWYNWHLEQSKQAVIDWELNLMNSKQTAWGAHMLKYDGEPMWPNGNPSGDPMHPSNNTSDNLMLEGSNKWYGMIENFKSSNTNAGIYHCSSGGELMTIEALRFAEVTSTSDGEVGDINGYWNSLLFPVDKLMQGGYYWGGPYNKSVRWDLRFAPQLNMSNPWDSETLADKEEKRKDFERYRYLRSQGVAGRWVKVYRPIVSAGAVKEHYLQKMKGDGTKGVIHICSDASIGSNVTIYPKGLNPTQNYSVITLEGGTAQATNTGSYWMTNGITLTPLRAGEMIFLNMDNMPGYGNDSSAPTVPQNVKKATATYLYHPGVELTWTASTDNNWLSYYEIFRNGISVDKVSIGTFYFDPYGNANDTYEVRAVDGKGNVSAKAAAALNGTVVSPLDRTGWTASASYANDQAGKVFDKDFTTRWTGDNQSNSRTFQIDMKSAKTFDTVILDSGSAPYDYPLGYDCYVSNDNSNWYLVASGQGSDGTGSVKYISFPTRTARYIKIVSKSNTTARGWWSINELYVYNMGNSLSNYLTNGDFETGSPTQTPPGWTTWSDNNYDADYTEATGGSYSGTYHLAHYKGTPYRITTYQTAGCLPNGMYTAKAWIRSSGGQNTCRMEITNYGGNSIYTNILQASSWTQITVANINVTNSQCTIGFYSDAPSTKWLAVDKVELIKQ